MESVEKAVAKSLLDIKAVMLRPENPFTWASGWKSPIYCDNRKVLSYPEIRENICQWMAEIIRKRYPDVEVIAGVATGAIAHGYLVAHILEEILCLFKHGLVLFFFLLIVKALVVVVEICFCFKECIGKILCTEILQIVKLFANANKLYRDTKFAMNGNDDKSMNIGANLAVGTTVIRMEATVDELINSTGNTLKELKERCPNASSYLLVHCGGRRLGIGDRMEEVYKQLKKVAGDVPFLVVFTFGEYGYTVDDQTNTTGGLMLSFTAFEE